MPKRPILFVAREPDETLRTFLPVIAELQQRDREASVLFHHEPSAWAVEKLSELGVAVRRVSLPKRPTIGGPLAKSRPALAFGELEQLRRARRLAFRLVQELSPSAIVVIQDTLLLERFLVREANRGHIPTIVTQWAFTYPQAMYDLLNRIKRGQPSAYGESAPRDDTESDSGARTLPGRLYDLAQRLLGVSFNLANSYGGGEARVFAVLGNAFREQFVAQGVSRKRIYVTGHPLHDAAFAQRAALTPQRASELKRRYGLPPEGRVILYATQPVLWRAVLTREQLNENVRTIARAVASLGPDYLLVLKLHPREAIDDYAPALEGELPVRLIQEADIAELIAPAEVFISSSSSTVLLAMMLDKPIITVNFNRVPHFDFYESVGGSLHVKSPSSVADALRQALFDERTRDRLESQRSRVVESYARFDGLATRRLADLIVGEVDGRPVLADE